MIQLPLGIKSVTAIFCDFGVSETKCNKGRVGVTWLRGILWWWRVVSYTAGKEQQDSRFPKPLWTF